MKVVEFPLTNTRGDSTGQVYGRGYACYAWLSLRDADDAQQELHVPERDEQLVVDVTSDG